MLRKERYKIFTPEFDEIKKAEELEEESELTKLRKMLDQQLTNLQGVENTTLTSEYKKVSWTVSPPPNTSQGYFDVEVTSSADTGFLSATTYQTVNYEDGMGRYETNIGPFITLNQKYLYRVVNTRSYLGISGSNVTTTATSRINKFDTDSPSLLRY